MENMGVSRLRDDVTKLYKTCEAEGWWLWIDLRFLCFLFNPFSFPIAMQLLLTEDMEIKKLERT